MPTLNLSDDPEDNELLNWLDRHSVSLAQGLPVRLLMARWQRAGFDPERLVATLQRVMDQRWVAPTPGAEPPHLRFTAEGYARLLDASTTQALALKPFEEQEQPVAPAVATTQEASTRAAALAPIEEPAALAGLDEEAPADLFLPRGSPMTELGLRNQVLSIFRDLRMRPKMPLIAVTLTRYWQETGLRADDLRRALDVVVRDGYVLPQRDGLDLYWLLTDAGAEWLKAPLTPAPLLAAAPPIADLQAATDDGDLRVVAATACLRQMPADGGSFDYAAVRADWQGTGLDENALLHALDWLAKDGAVVTSLDERHVTRLQITEIGRRYATLKPDRAAQRLIKLLGGKI